jgi:hypothetical protein
MRTWAAGGVAEEGQAIRNANVRLRNAVRQFMGYMTPVDIDFFIIHRDRRDAEGFTRLLLDWGRMKRENRMTKSKAQGVERWSLERAAWRLTVTQFRCEWEMLQEPGGSC